MKFGVFLLLSLCVLIGAEEKCREDSAAVCVESLVSALLRDVDEEEVCKLLKQATDCLRSEAEKCFGDEPDEEIEAGLQTLEDILNHNCMDSGTRKSCSPGKAEECIDSLMGAFLDGSEKEAICKELRQATDCLKNEADECLRDDRDEEVEKGLQTLEDILNEDCRDSDAEMEKCIEDNKNDVNECIEEKSTEIFSFKDINNNALQCIMYFEILECFLDRVGEKCGEKAYNVTRMEAKSNIPDSIKEACKDADLHGRYLNTEETDFDDTIHSVHLLDGTNFDDTTYSVHLLDDDRKKK